MRYWRGSKSGPKIDFSQSSSRSNSMPPIMTTAAMATPIWLPMPPSTTMARIVAQFHELKDRGLTKPWPRAEERAGEAAEQRAHGEGGELGVDGVDAERAAGDLVLAQRFPGAPDGQAPHALGDAVGQQRQRQDHVIEEDRPGAAVGELGRPKNVGEAVSSLRVERQAEEGDARDAGDAGIAVGQRRPS